MIFMGFLRLSEESKDRACECQDLAKCFILINLVQQFYGVVFYHPAFTDEKPGTQGD